MIFIFKIHNELIIDVKHFFLCSLFCIYRWASRNDKERYVWKALTDREKKISSSNKYEYSLKIPSFMFFIYNQNLIFTKQLQLSVQNATKWLTLTTEILKIVQFKFIKYTCNTYF